MAALLATDESGNQATSSDALLNRADAAIEQAKLLQGAKPDTHRKCC
jgi:hypothetical protein